MSTYTEKMDNWLWETDDYILGLDFLNSAEFRSFGDGLIEIIKSKMPEACNETPLNYLRQQCIEKRIPISEIASNSTLRNWFGGKPRPDKSDDSRQSMFLIAFALGLTLEETNGLFAKVYLDRSFNLRSPHEFIYKYCIENGLTYQRAEIMVDQVSLVEDGSDSTVMTRFLSEQLLLQKSENDIVLYINNNSHNFSLNSISAKRLADRLLEQAKRYAEKETGKSNISTNFLYSTIMNQIVSTSKGTTTLFRNNRLPKEIRNRFPQPITFSKAEPTSEELRKLIVLLGSYPIWYEIEYSDSDFKPDYDEYVEEINSHLTDAGMPLLYPGNPFDWLFLFCAKEDSPLTMFRDLIDEVEHAGE